MKKIIVSVFAIVMFFIISTQVEAAGVVSLSANKTSVDIGDTFNISVNLSGASVATLTARVSYDTSKIEYVSGPSNSNFSGGRVIYTWTDATGGASPLTGGIIATFTFRAKAAGNASFSVSGDFFTPDETSVNPSFSGVAVNVKKEEVVVPPDNSGDDNSGENTGGDTGDNNGNNTGNNSGGTGNNQGGNNGDIGGSGNTGNIGGSGNTGNIGGSGGVTSGNTTSNNQQIIKSSNNNLKSLQLDIEGISPTFNKNTTQYYITIPENTNNINITALLEDAKANIQITGNTNIPVGNSQIKILVTAENGNQKQYLINVTKTNNSELSNANLENLAIENVTLIPEFNSEITDYTAEFSEDIQSLNILAIPQREAATVTIEGNENLQIGDNVIKITVLAEDGETSKIYNIVVKKNEVTEEENENEDIEANNEKIDNEIENETEKDSLTWIIAIIALSIIIITSIIIILKRKKHNDENI